MRVTLLNVAEVVRLQSNRLTPLTEVSRLRLPTKEEGNLRRVFVF